MSDDGVGKDFRDAVNMTPGELERWLKTEESRSVGDTTGGGESVGHEMGRHIVDLLRTKAADRADADLDDADLDDADLDDADLDDTDRKRMRKVVGYVHRHLAQRPSGDVRDTRWRYSLMNWGHDPLKS